jgi:hypothetical protein
VSRRTTTRTRARRGVAAGLALAVLLAGCSDDDGAAGGTSTTEATSRPDTSTGPTSTLPRDAARAKVVPQFDGDVDSPYCRAARGWAARQIEGFVEDDPVEVEAYSRDRDAYVALARSTAPPELREHWEQFGERLVDLAAAWELSQWDLLRADEILPQELRDAMNGNDPDGLVIQVYDSDVCAIGEPPMVETDYQGSDPALCGALVELAALRSRGLVGGVDAGAAIEGAATSTTQPTGGPDGLAEDVLAYRAWMSEHAVPVLRRHGGDLARVLREGSGADALAVSAWEPEIRDVAGRVERYVADVCVTVPEDDEEGEPSVDGTDEPPIDDPGDEVIDETGGQPKPTRPPTTGG